MELLSAEFYSALLAIIVIDLVLAGDNAIVIALAARNLPPHLRGKAIVWGTVGAIAVRTALTLIVVWVLKIPGLLMVGGAALVWIAYRLLLDSNAAAGQHPAPAQGFWGAMKTIVVADALMGLDNVLAIAGAAHGNFALVITGLLISMPIVVWGSRLVLKLIQRWPAIIYVGAAVLAWTAAKMMTSEPLLEAVLARYPLLVLAIYVAFICGVLSAGFVGNFRQVQVRVAEHVVQLPVAPVEAPAIEEYRKGGTDMERVLIPVDATPNSLKAVQHVVNRVVGNRAIEVHLLHVRTPLSRHVAQFLSKRTRASFHRDEAEKALRPARELLERSGVPHAAHVELGDRAQTIDRVARRLRVNGIVMGTARGNSFTRMLQDSVTNRVIELTPVPVEVVAGDSVSRLERIGVPAGIGVALALLYAAAD